MEEKENLIEEIQQEAPAEPKAEETPKEQDFSKFESADDPSVFKVDLSAPVKAEEPIAEDKKQEVEEPVVSEITEESPVENVQEPVKEAVEEIKQSENTGNALPEGVGELVKFMNETGGTVQDFVSLNTDYSKMDNLTALQEYYKKTKPHLTNEEISFMMEDTFSYDEELDEEKDIKRKKLAMKEQVANAKQYLEDQKTKYYTDIKPNATLNEEQQKAVDFFNRYNKEKEQNQKTLEERSSRFQENTNNLFNQEFKGFEFNLGEKKFRFNVKNADQVRETQSDINNFVKRFLDDSGNLTDAKGYHKSLYTAMNADAIAKHFYEQGRADAIKNSVSNAKNIDMSPRQSMNDGIEVGGVKYRVLGDDSNSLKFKIKKK